MSSIIILRDWITAMSFSIAAVSCTSSKTISRQERQPERSHVNKEKGSGRYRHPSYSLATIGDRPYIGIGLITDSATHLSRSFALYELLNDHPLTVNGDPLVPVIVDYPFAAPFAITGMTAGENATLKLYKNGKKIKEIVSAGNWRDMYTKIVQELTGDSTYKVARKFAEPNEGSIDNIDANHIRSCMPGSIAISVPYSSILDTFSRNINLHYLYTGDAYTHNKQLFGKYNEDKENKLFFFRNDHVPENLKTVARPLVFPLYRSLTPSLTYLSSGKTLVVQKDFGAALNSYTCALLTSNTILASPYERATVRALAFAELSRTHREMDVSRTQTVLLFQLGADLNNAYLREHQSMVQRDQYYEKIQKVADLCGQAEDKAREIRGQKRLGGLLAAINYAGALGSVSAEDNTTSDAFMSQAETYFATSMEQANGVSQALQQQFEDVESKINTRSFLSGDGSSSEISSSVVAREVYYHLVMNSAIVKDILWNYAANKPRLFTALRDFYGDPSNADLAKEVFRQMVNIEARVLNIELRNLPVNESILSTF